MMTNTKLIIIEAKTKTNNWKTLKKSKSEAKILNKF